MILIITNKLDAHADFVINELNHRGEGVARFNTEDYPSVAKIGFGLERESSSYLELPIGKIMSSDIKTVWYRRPLPPVISEDVSDVDYKRFAVQEARSVMDGWWYSFENCLWVNHPLNERRAKEKLFQLQKASRNGFCVPDTLICSDPETAIDFIERHQRKVIIKPLHQDSFLRGDSYEAPFTRVLTSKDIENINAIKYAPCILQEYVEKQHELRITVIGDEVFVVELNSQETGKGKVDWRLALFDDLSYRIAKLPPELCEMIAKYNKELGLNFGAYDFVYTPDGRYVFIELNPNGQWLWLERDTGLPMVKMMANLLSQAG